MRGVVPAILIAASLAALGCDRKVHLAQNREPTVRYTDTKTGIGPPVQKGRIVQVHYVGRLPSGEPFLNTYDDGKPYSFQLGEGTVIAGIDAAVVGMRPGGVRVAKIPPELHWGRDGYANIVPRNATLEFEITLVGVN
ncbi:MAG: FKBP-type peptidyl-prolyl cis-trans isomerase [Planctomycetota bacterium]|nr:FKBP-type peptidyl-prolyl cis-trans isomerase [Planctomycetota bacterium]